MLVVQDISRLAKDRLNDLHVAYQKLVKIYSVNVSPEMVEDAQKFGKFTIWGQEFMVFRSVLMLPDEVVAARQKRMAEYLHTVSAEIENFKREGWMHPARAEMLLDGLKAITYYIEEN